MTSNVDIANRAFQLIGSQSVITSLSQDSTEAQSAALIMFQLRDELNRMAPWACATRFRNLTYVSSVPTTPENSGTGPPMWQPGMPAPPWAYEYQYPVDCLRARYLIPQYMALAGGVPIYPPGTATAAQGGGWTGPALKFLISTDTFYSVTFAGVMAGGSGYNVGDVVFLPQPTFTFNQQYPPLTNQLPSQQFTMSVGAPASVQVTSTTAGGVITAVSLLNQIYGEDSGVAPGFSTTLSGSYFAPYSFAPVGQGYTVGANGQAAGGVGAEFSILFTPAPQAQRVVLCNQENAIMCYNAVVTDPNVMDLLFQDAWISILAARLCYSMGGDRGRCNDLIGRANAAIMESRRADGNEEIVVNDVTPDFLRIRGNWGGPNLEFTPNMSFDWGSFYSPY